MLFSLLLTLGLVAGNPSVAPPENLSSAERGLWLLLNKPYMASEATQEEFEDLWKVWLEPLRSQAEKATPEERRKLTFERYGHIEMAGRDMPMGYVRDAAGGWTPNCLACHGGKVAGDPIPGLPNSHFAFQSWTNDIIQYRVEFEGRSRMDFAQKLIVPLSRSDGTTNAQIFSVVLAAMRDDALDFSPQQVQRVPKMLHHDLDAPPFWNLKKKRMLYIDGYVEKSPRVIMQFVMVPSNTGETIRSWENDFRDILAFAESVEPPPYPRPVDRSLAERGEKIFQQSCADCHGTYGPNGSYPEKMIPIDEIGTDRRRLDGIPPEHRQFFTHGWIGEDGKIEVVQDPAGYVAPPLDGIWASAPYLHNGSVPTLWHLMHPDQRPRLWQRTPDGYDHERMGLEVTTHEELPAEVRRPDDRRRYFDTSLPGKSSAGHDFPNELDEPDRAAVIEYLKTL